MKDDFDFDSYFDGSPFVDVEPRQRAPEAPQRTRQSSTTRSRQTAPAARKRRKKKSSPAKTLIFLAVIVIAFVLIVKSCGGKDEPQAPAEATQAPVTEAVTEKGVDTITPQNINDFDNEIVALSKLMLDEYIYDYEISLAPQKWTIAMFDDNGAVIANTNVGRNGVYESFFCVLTPVFEDNKITAGTRHYLSVGNDIFYDDGYCDDVFETLAGLAG